MTDDLRAPSPRAELMLHRVNDLGWSERKALLWLACATFRDVVLLDHGVWINLAVAAWMFAAYRTIGVIYGR